jgi:cyclic pyranopterin phosphate synthase
MDAGLKRVYFTGGEPLTSPMARPVLEGLPEPGPDASYTLITNGTRVRTHRSWLARTYLDKVKVSLHYFSDMSLRVIAGTRIGIDTVLDGIDVAREIFERVELNTLLQKENAHEVRQILDFALERRLPVQFIELVGTDFNESRAASAVPADDIIAHLRTLTSDEHIEVAGVGQGRRVFRIDGVEIDVIHRDLGRHHVGQCGSCPLRSQCVEGFWALRVDHGGGMQPCLLRDDLRLDLNDLIADPARLAQAVAGHVAAFTEGTL